MIIAMIALGGVTRLTQSGLSMVKWEPIMGTLPPISMQEWNAAFNAYKQSPEFIHYNSDFSLSDFKNIFYWEYFHRLMGRIIGLFFIIPCIVFWIKGSFSKKLKKEVLLILILGVFQAVLGWFMVKSGLVNKPHVSHFRLCAHLFTAIVLLLYIFWVALSLKYEVKASEASVLSNTLSCLVCLIFFQIIYGAFVAGLNAGLMYNTFPKMGTHWIPPDFIYIWKRQGWQSLINSGGIVQFIHRIIALLILINLGVLYLKTKKINLSYSQELYLHILILAICFQFISGILTLLNAVPIALGVIHQVGAVLVLLILFLLVFSTKSSSKSRLYQTKSWL